MKRGPGATVSGTRGIGTATLSDHRRFICLGPILATVRFYPTPLDIVSTSIHRIGEWRQTRPDGARLYRILHLNF